MRELWLVDLDRQTLEQRVLSDAGRLEAAGVFHGAEVVESPVFPGLRTSSNELFDR